MYYDPDSPETILTAIDDLTEYIQENVPFQGVIGFSQGASLAAMVLARARYANPPPFAFAISSARVCLIAKRRYMPGS